MTSGSPHSTSLVGRGIGVPLGLRRICGLGVDNTASTSASASASAGQSGSSMTLFPGERVRVGLEPPHGNLPGTALAETNVGLPYDAERIFGVVWVGLMSSETDGVHTSVLVMAVLDEVEAVIPDSSDVPEDVADEYRSCVPAFEPDVSETDGKDFDEGMPRDRTRAWLVRFALDVRRSAIVRIVAAHSSSSDSEPDQPCPLVRPTPDLRTKADMVDSRCIRGRTARGSDIGTVAGRSSRGLGVTLRCLRGALTRGVDVSGK
jgi:hypothetical protein